MSVDEMLDLKAACQAHLDQALACLQQADHRGRVARRDKWISSVFLVGTWAAAGAVMKWG